MLTEQELEKFEALLTQDCDLHYKMATFHFRNAVKEMSGEIRRLWGELKDTDDLAFGAMDSYEDESLKRTWLEKEADWLAEKHALRYECPGAPCGLGQQSGIVCLDCWREAARREARSREEMMKNLRVAK